MAQKAEKLMEEANKKANKFDWFGASKQQNMEDASELYVKAAAAFKMSKEFEKAGECYKKAAECQMAAGNEIEAKQHWQESGKCYRHVDPNLAIDAYKNAIELNLQGNRYNQAARLQEEIGDMLAEDDYYDKAIEAYEQSAQYYETENDHANAQKRRLKIAHMSVKDKNYERSIEIFERVASENVDNNLLRWKVKEYLFKAMLCVICQGVADDVKKWDKQQATQEKYKNISDMYATAREAKLIDTIIEALQKTDIQLYKNSVAEFDRIQRIEKWCTDLLLIIESYLQEQIHAPPPLLDEDNGNNNNNKNNESEVPDEDANKPIGSDPFQPEVDENAPEI